MGSSLSLTCAGAEAIDLAFRRKAATYPSSKHASLMASPPTMFVLTLKFIINEPSPLNRIVFPEHLH